MCFDDALCCSNWRYACCCVAKARAPNSFVSPTLPIPQLQLRHSFSDDAKDQVPGFHTDIDEKRKEEVEASIANVNDKRQFELYFHYFYWLEYLRSEQPWWNGNCDKFWRRILWIFLGVIYETIFATPIFLIGSALYIVSLVFIMLKFVLNFFGLTTFTRSTLYSMHFCQLTKDSATYDSLVFSAYRLPTYLVSATYALFWNMARYHAGAFRVNLMPDSALLAALLTGPSARDLTVLFDDGTELSANGPSVRISSKPKKALLQKNNDDAKTEPDNAPNNSLIATIKSQLVTTLQDGLFSPSEDNPLLLNILDEDSIQATGRVTEESNQVSADSDDLFTSVNNADKVKAQITGLGAAATATAEKVNPPKVVGYRMEFAAVPTPAAQQLTLFPGNYLRVYSMEYKLKPNTDKFQVAIQIYDSKGVAHSIKRPDTTEADYATKSKSWNAAKAHVQCILCWYAPAWSHNWVHFHLLDVAASRSPLTVSKNSVLGTLLRSHLKYVTTINIAGLASGIPNPQSEDDCLRCFPWKGQPVTPGQFASTIAQNTRYHYLKLNKVGLIQEAKQVFPPYWVIVRRYYGKDDTRNHPQATQWRGIIPALDFLSDYYYVIEDFVKKLWGVPLISKANPNLDESVPLSDDHLPPPLTDSLLERDIYKQWLSDLQSNGLPGLLLPILNRVDVVTTIIWTSSIVHCSDHISYGNVFMQWPMYSSYVDFDLNQSWKEVLWNSNVNKGAYVSREILDVFVNYRYSMFKLLTQDMLTSPGLYGNWSNVSDKNKRVQLQKLHAEFLGNLKTMNERWGWYMDVKAISASTCY